MKITLPNPIKIFNNIQRHRKLIDIGRNWGLNPDTLSYCNNNQPIKVQ